jgi:hypothetical protein
VRGALCYAAANPNTAGVVHLTEAPMDATRFDNLTRALDARSRRRLLGMLSGAAVAGAPLAVLIDAAAKKKRKKRKQSRPGCRTLTCAETCPSACDLCFPRPGAPAMCGDSLSNTDCTAPCSSDNDCASPHPFCTLPQRVIRATGQPTSPVCSGFPTPAGFCTLIPACP